MNQEQIIFIQKMVCFFNFPDNKSVAFSIFSATLSGQLMNGETVAGEYRIIQ